MHPQDQAQASTTIRMFDDSTQILMDEGWFDMASLAAIAGCNKQLYGLVDRADHLWKPYVADIKFPQTRVVDDADLEKPGCSPTQSCP